MEQVLIIPKYYYVTKKIVGVTEDEMKDIWSLITTELVNVARKYQVRFDGFILHQGRFHLICRIEEADLHMVMNSLFLRTSRRFPSSVRWRSHYKPCVLMNSVIYTQIYRYFYQSARDLPYSHFARDCETNQSWLEEQLSESEKEIIRLGLRKFHFDVSQKNRRAFLRLSMPSQTLK